VLLAWECSLIRSAEIAVVIFLGGNLSEQAQSLIFLDVLSLEMRFVAKFTLQIRVFLTIKVFIFKIIYFKI